MFRPQEELRALLIDPKESLNVELKSWIDPATRHGVAKIAIACIALRNNDGGHLVIGFNDDGTPGESPPGDVRETYSPELIQEIVAKYASASFEVTVDFVEHNGQQYPIVSVPAGVETPVATKKGLQDDDEKKELIPCHTVYVRSLQSNNLVSSAKPRFDDWDSLNKRCFDNREADIGAFIRRHLAGLDPSRLVSALQALTATPAEPTSTEPVEGLLDLGHERFKSVAAAREYDVPTIGYREVAVALQGQVPSYSANKDFLDRLFSRKPEHSGWPPWIDTRVASRQSDQPFVTDKAWEAFYPDENDDWFGAQVDFWHIDPVGHFYRIEGLRDDLVMSLRDRHSTAPDPNTQLDFGFQISRAAEDISTCLWFARSMGCTESDTVLEFAFRWSRLDGRRLTHWMDRMDVFPPRGPAVQDGITTTVGVPLITSQSAIPPFVRASLGDLFRLFGGMEFDNRVYERLVSNRLSQRF